MTKVRAHMMYTTGAVGAVVGGAVALFAIGMGWPRIAKLATGKALFGVGLMGAAAALGQE